MLFVSFHGGKPDKNPHKNNIHAYDKDGAKLTSTVLQQSGEITLDELRGIYLVDGLLYVVNANKNENSVLCYSGNNTDYKFVGKLVSRADCFVSSQDTNVVTRLKVSNAGKNGSPAPVAPSLPSTGTFLPGTFVASSVSLDPPTTPMALPQGLAYSAPVGDKKHSVRGIEWAGEVLYVADQPSHRIKVYGKNGELFGQSNEVESPTHLVARKGTLFVSGGDQIMSATLPKKPGNLELAPVKWLKVKNSSGMAFTPTGKLYVASRTEKRIYKFDAQFKPVEFDTGPLPDDPEFLLHL
jgi:hypothetical protein